MLRHATTRIKLDYTTSRTQNRGRSLAPSALHAVCLEQIGLATITKMKQRMCLSLSLSGYNNNYLFCARRQHTIKARQC